MRVPRPPLAVLAATALLALLTLFGLPGTASAPTSLPCDLYAAGVLFGLSRGMSLAECGRLGSIAAGEIISHYGARPQTALAARA